MKVFVARQYLIGGRVQGVGFRYFVQRAAMQIGVAGWTRNLDDGRVEVQAQAPVAELDEFESRLRQGPTHAEVRSFEVAEAAPSDLTGFQIR